MASSGRFDCKVKKIDITEFIEGRVTTYGGWSDLKVGGELELTYESSADGNVIVIGSDLGYGLFAIIKGDQLFEFDDGSIRVESLRIDPTSQIWFGEDYISSYTSLGQKRALSMRRYYKNDWEAIIIEQSHDDSRLKSSTVALSCRHKKDAIKKIISELKGFVSRLE